MLTKRAGEDVECVCFTFISAVISSDRTMGKSNVFAMTKYFGLFFFYF